MILLVSSNRELAESMANDIRQEGFNIEILTRYQDVIMRLYQSPQYHMLLLDMDSMDENLSELCQKIKKDPHLQYIPLICIIRKEMLVDQLMAFEFGADEFIYVPYTTPELQLKMRALQRLLELQDRLREKENQLKSLRQVQRVLVTLSHYINNSLTPLFMLVQTMDEKSPEDARRLKDFVSRTVQFINKVLLTLNNLVQNGEIKVLTEGVYKNLLLDIEGELKKLQESTQ